MDPFKRATRPAGDYLRSEHLQGQGSVPKARAHREADRLYRMPGTRVPNNPEMARQFLMEDAQRLRVYGIPYQDGRVVNPPSTGVDFVVQPPAPAVGRMMTPQPMVATEQLGDLRWADQVKGMGGPLGQQPNDLVKDPGQAAQVARYSGTGQPMGVQLPPAPPAGMEDLRFAQVPMPPVPDMGLPASRVEGSPSDARFPAAGRGASPTAGGRPAVMPQPQR